jgi:microcystin-dependent protein
MHEGDGHTLGEKGGEQAHTLSMSEMPAHTHALLGIDTNATTNIPTGNSLGAATAVYHTPTSLTALHPSSVTNVGGSQAHQNMCPFLTLSFCIALQGIFPSPN